MRIDSIVFDCRDAAPLARFWAEALGWSVAPYDEEELERLASKLLERETLDREDVATMLHDVQRIGTLAFSRPGGPVGPATRP